MLLQNIYRVLNDDGDTQELLNYVLNQAGFEVSVCGSAEECLHSGNRKQFQAIILDGFFGAASSTDVCRELRRMHPKLPIIYLSGEARQAEIDKALASGANAYLIKPCDFEQLTATVSRLIKES